MNKYLHMLPYILVNAITFYLLPMMIKNTGTAMVVMLVGLPLICFVTFCKGFKLVFLKNVLLFYQFSSQQ